ncbi:S24 family peptidase [Streptococcus thoraltensis]|uniref:S24 family peptidase n=1 Tax=Streptococcus thoraltensis TaxID=55085 RepID=UPI001F57DAF6|nr:S24 family peptidase [Streptococcus thoraltensis]
MSENNKEIFSKNLNRLMNTKGVDRNKLCLDLNLKYTTVRDWQKGITYPRIGKIELLANYFNVNKSDLIENKTSTSLSSPTPQALHLDRELKDPRHSEWISNGEELLKKQTDEQNTEENSTSTVSNNVVQFPTKDDFESLIVHGLESAGDGIWQEDETDIEVRIPKSKIPEVFDDLALVIGDSMRPKLHNGDILFVTFTKQIEIGQIGVFRTSKGNFVKKLQPDRLESLNPDYEDIYFEEDEFAEAIGVVQDVYRK